MKTSNHRWHVVIDRPDGSRDYLTPPMMPDGEREWGDLAEAATFRGHEWAKEMALAHGGRPVPA
jgi:hypothetical protein